jgi:tRNA(Ile)-lysidine synthase
MNALDRLTDVVASSAPPPEGAAVLVAVSGGGDSVGLLHALARLAPVRGWRLVAAHLDHGLRAGTAERDRAFVEDLAARLRVAVIAERHEVRPGPGESLEEAARTVRRAFLSRAAAAEGAGRIALGHTGDDLAETVLLRLTRGTGPGGLAAMRTLEGIWWRPFLGLGGEEIRACLREAGEPWCEDETNRDLRFDRNRVRREVLPVLARLNPRVVEALARAARLAGEDEELLESLAREALNRLERPVAGAGVALEAAGLEALPPALAGRVVRLAVARVREDPRGVSLAHVRALLALCGEPTGRALSLPGGSSARAERGAVVLRPPAPRVPEERPLDCPGSADWGRMGTLRARRLSRAAMPERPETVCGPRRALLDADRAAAALRVRAPRAGDRFRPLGAPGERLLRDFLRDAGVPAPERGLLPLVLCGEQIAWVTGHRIDERFRLGPETRGALELIWEPSTDHDRDNDRS